MVAQGILCIFSKIVHSFSETEGLFLFLKVNEGYGVLLDEDENEIVLQKWEYAVFFVANSGDVEMKIMHFFASSIGTLANLLLKAFTRTGYTFTG